MGWFARNDKVLASTPSANSFLVKSRTSSMGDGVRSSHHTNPPSNTTNASAIRPTLGDIQPSVGPSVIPTSSASSAPVDRTAPSQSKSLVLPPTGPLPS